MTNEYLAIIKFTMGGVFGRAFTMSNAAKIARKEAEKAARMRPLHVGHGHGNARQQVFHNGLPGVRQGQSIRGFPIFELNLERSPSSIAPKAFP